jgi:hypothetical protein
MKLNFGRSHFFQHLSAKSRIAFALALVFVSPIFAGCGKSLYSVAANKKSDDAVYQDAILALNNDDYDTAADKLESLWNKKETQDLAQLFAISLLGKAGFSLFDVIQKALSAVSESDGDKDGSTGNAILDKISSVVGSSVTDDQLDTIKKAISILSQAPDQANTGLKFQKCLTAGIYAAPTLAGLTTTIAKLNTTLEALPTKLGSSGFTCGASSTVVNEVGEELSEVITQAASLATRVQDIESIVGACLPEGSTSNVNEVTTKVTNLATKSDKGCSIPASQQIGTFTLPSCMNDFVLASGGSTAAANDNKIAGCEVFLNCSGGTSCF